MGAAAVMAAGTAISAYGMYQQGRAAKAVGRYRQRAALMAAKAAEEEGERQAARHGERVRSLAGRQAAMYGSSGLLVGTGTQEKLLQQTYRVGREEVADIRLSAARRAWGIRSEGQAAAISGRLAARAANWQALGTSVAGLASASKMAAQAGGWWKWPT